MVQIVELRPSRELFNELFEKYQFCDTATPIQSYDLSANVHKQELNSDQNSFLEAQVFAYHNHLFKNDYDNSCWFVDINKKVWKFKNNELSQTFELSGDLDKSLYSPSICFAHKNLLVTLNGGRDLEIVHLGSNSDKIARSTYDTEPGILMDARFVETSGNLVIAVYSVAEVDSKKQSEIRIYTYACQTDNGAIRADKLLDTQSCKVSGTVEYLFIEESGNYIQVMSQKEVSFRPDPAAKKEESNDKSEEVKSFKYSWSQDEDAISVKVKVPEEWSSLKESVKVTMNRISVLVGDHVLVEGSTGGNLEASLTTWSRKGDLVEIDLTKQVSGTMWKELLVGDTDGEHLPNEALAAEIHSRLSHLCTEQQENGDGASAIGFNSEQLEDCDLEGKENSMQRINLKTHTQTHFALVGHSNGVLFSQKVKNKQVVCLRYDHAGCIWYFGNGDDENWEIEHKYNFPGYGYIEAGKKFKKFSISSPDGSFIALMEHSRHIFVYEKPKKDAKISKQRVIDLKTDSPIIGANVIDNDLLVLMADKLYQLQLHV